MTLMFCPRSTQLHITTYSDDHRQPNLTYVLWPASNMWGVQSLFNSQLMCGVDNELMVHVSLSDVELSALSGDVDTDGWQPINTVASSWHWDPRWRPWDRRRSSTGSLTTGQLHSSACAVSTHWQWTTSRRPLRQPTYVHTYNHSYVHLSIRPSHGWINGWSWRHAIFTIAMSCCRVSSIEKFWCPPLSGGIKQGRGGKTSHFLPLNVNVFKTVRGTSEVIIND